MRARKVVEGLGGLLIGALVFSGCDGGGGGGGALLLASAPGPTSSAGGTSASGGAPTQGSSGGSTSLASTSALSIDSITSQLAQVGQTLVVDLDATGATGPLNFVLTYDTVVDGVVGSGTNITALTGFTLDAATGVLSCTPSSGQIGVIEVLATVSDGSQVATFVFNLTISDNSWTVSPVPNLRVPVGVDPSLDFSLLPGLGDLTPSGGPVIYTLVYDNVADGLVVSGTAITDLLGATLSPSTGVLSWTPQGSQANTYECLLSATDGLTVSTYVFTLEVFVDLPPELALLGPYETSPGVPFLLDLRDTHSGNDNDRNGQALTYTIRYDTTLDGSVLAGAAPITSLGASFNSSTGVVSWTPEVSDAGSYELSISASDGTSSDVEIVHLHVRDGVTTYALLGGFDAGFSALDTQQEAPLIADLVPPGANLPRTLGYFAAASFKERIFLIGGSSDAAAQDASSRDVYSSEEGRIWTRHQNALPSGRSMTDVVVFDDGGGAKLFLFGGQYWNGVTHLRLDEVLVSSDGVNWSLHPTRLPEALSGVSATVFNGKVWLVGGRDGLTASPKVYSFDGNTFTGSSDATVGDLPVGVDAGSLVVHRGKMILLGGQTTANVPLATIYTSANGSSWQLELSLLPVARSHGAAISDGQRVWFCGGFNGLNAQGERFYSSNGINFTTYGVDLTQATFAARLLGHARTPD